MLTPGVPPPTEHLTALLTTFGLTTAAEEIVPRLTQAGHAASVPVLGDVFDAEAEARRQCRIARLRRAARRPRSAAGAAPLSLELASPTCGPRLLQRVVRPLLSPRCRPLTSAHAHGGEAAAPRIRSVPR
jgi:hypothetical protein